MMKNLPMETKLNKMIEKDWNKRDSDSWVKKARDGTFIRLSSVTSEFISGGGEVGSWDTSQFH